MGKVITGTVGVLIGLFVAYILFVVVALVGIFNRISMEMLVLQLLGVVVAGIVSGYGMYRLLNYMFDVPDSSDSSSAAEPSSVFKVPSE